MSAALKAIPVDDAPLRAAGDVRRVTEADIRVIGPAVCERLKDKFPAASTDALMSYLRAQVLRLDVLFVRTENAIAMFEVVREPLCDSDIRERFVFALPKTIPEAVAEAADLYPFAMRWGDDIYVNHMYIEELSDVPRDMIKERVGKIRLKQQTYVALCP